MQFQTDNMNRLLGMKAGEDTVWAAVQVDVFRMQGGYFGHYLDGDPRNPWSVYCIQGISPNVFKPRELTYIGRFDVPGDSIDHLFVFSAKNENSYFHDYAMPWYYDGFMPKDEKRLSSRMFSCMLTERCMLDFNKVFFDRDECAAKCRGLNGNSCASSAMSELGKWYEKTLDDMQRQLTECLNADYVVDPVEKLKTAIEGKEES